MFGERVWVCVVQVEIQPHAELKPGETGQVLKQETFKQNRGHRIYNHFYTQQTHTRTRAHSP